MPSRVKSRIRRLVESSLGVWLGAGSMVWISSGRLGLRVSAWGIRRANAYEFSASMRIATFTPPFAWGDTVTVNI
jgi:hypothetical protein